MDDEDEEERILVGKNTFIYPKDSPAVIKKKLLIAGGVKAKDAEKLTDIFDISSGPNTGLPTF